MEPLVTGVEVMEGHLQAGCCFRADGENREIVVENSMNHPPGFLSDVTTGNPG